MERTRGNANALRWRHWAPLVLLPLLYVTIVSYQLQDLHLPPQPNANALNMKVAGVQQEWPPMQQRVRKAETPALRLAPEPSSSILKGRRTMVLVINFVDSTRCGQTLQSLFANAAHPELLRVSIHDQIFEAKGDLTCVDAYCRLVDEINCRRDQIVSTKVDASQAAGPTVARAITEKSIGDEEFCLGLDSHLVFTPKWDEQLVGNWEATENPNAILTVYPKSTELLTDHSKDHQMGVQCLSRIETADADSMVQYQAVRWVDKTNTTKPRLMAQFAGGFNFGSCQAYRDVPNDPFTPILFYGEEYARAARLWTWGYDMYAPSVDVVYHFFETRKKIWDLDWSTSYPILQRSKRRVRAILGLPVSSEAYDHTDIHKYALGTKRTFAQWQNFSGIDPQAKFANGVAIQFENCGELTYVPYNIAPSADSGRLPPPPAASGQVTVNRKS